MDKIVITKAQKRILIIVSIVAAAFIIFAFFIYIPSRKELAKLKMEYAAAEREVGQIKGAGGPGMTLEKAIITLDDRLKVLNDKFPEKEELILRELSVLLAKSGIEVISLRPQKKQVVGSSPVKIKGCLAHEMPIAMTLRARYKKLGEFFNVLETEFPIFLSAESVQMRPVSGNSSGLLNVELNMKAYLICPEARSR